MSLEGLEVGPPVELTFLTVGESIELGPGLPGPVGPPGPVGGSGLGTASRPLSGHRVVTPLEDGSLDYASNDNPGHLAAPLWVTATAAGTGGEIEFVVIGLMTEPSWSWTPGPVYLGVNGVLTQTPPAAPAAAFLAQVGFATSATSLFVDRLPSIKLT